MTASNSTVRWGIISTAGIAERAFVPAVRQTERGELVAVASRSRDKAASFADKQWVEGHRVNDGANFFFVAR